MATGIGARNVYRIGEGVGELRHDSESLPALEHHQVLVELSCLSLNYRDLLYIDSEPVSAGLVPGSDGAGSIIAVGKQVEKFREGDRVMPSFFLEWIDGRYDVTYRRSALGGGVDGTFSSHIVVPESCLVRIPDRMSFRDASCLPCAAVTAWNALVGRSKIHQGDTVLVQGTGGVSLFAIQIAKALGAEPILISGSNDKIALARGLGVEHAVNYRHAPDWEDAILDLTNGQGCDRVVELIGNRNMSRSIKCLRPGGTISYIGCLGGFEGGFDPLELMYKNANLEAIYVGSRADLERVVSDLTRWNIAPVIDEARFSFNELPEALGRMKRGEHLGKIVVDL